jgi:hypothetical protein
MVNWAKQSIALATFGFITLVIFISMSMPFDFLMGTINNESIKAGVDSNVSPIITMIRNLFGLLFLLSMVGLIVWFFLGSHEDEYEEH